MCFCALYTWEFKMREIQDCMLFHQLHFTSYYYKFRLIYYFFFWVFVSVILIQSNIYFLKVKNEKHILCMLIKTNHKIFHWLLLRDHFKTVHGRLYRKLSRVVSCCPFLLTVIDRLFSVVQHCYIDSAYFSWSTILTIIKRKCLFICFINNAMSFICQPNKMVHIAVALFEAILGRSLHIWAYIYICICTEQWHVHYIIHMEVSNLPQKTGLFLELNCSTGWSCSETWP